MVRIKEDLVNVIGDSIDACLYSRYLADNSIINSIDHHTTGQYGGFYFDEHKDDSYSALFVSEKQLNKIKEFLPDVQVIEVTENYLKTPIKKMRFSSPYDEYITYPINRGSFELEMDYDENILRSYSFEEFIDEYKKCKNVTKLMKNIFSDYFYMNLIKKIGCNQWNINQSQMDPSRLYSMLNLGHLDENKRVKYYYPIKGASQLCKDLLKHPKINVIETNRKNIRSKTKSELNKVTYIFEYVDYYMDFMFGGLDYIAAKTELHSKSISENKYFKVLTPFDKKYHCYFGVDTNTYKTYNENFSITSHDFRKLLMVPSQNNYRKLSDYKKVSNVSKNLKIIVT